MAYFAIAFIAPNYRDYSNQWLKAYEPGTTTPKSMALDSAAAVTVAKLQLNADGFLKSAGDALVIPYIDGAYDLWLFPTSAEADANDTSSAIRVADDINASGSGGALSQDYEFATVAAMVASTIVFPIGKMLKTKGGVTVSDGLGATYITFAPQALGTGDETLADANIAVFQYSGATNKTDIIPLQDRTSGNLVLRSQSEIAALNSSNIDSVATTFEGKQFDISSSVNGLENTPDTIKMADGRFANRVGGFKSQRLGVFSTPSALGHRLGDFTYAKHSQNSASLVSDLSQWAPYTINDVGTGSLVTQYVDSEKADNSGDGLSWANAKRDIGSAQALTPDIVLIKSGFYGRLKNFDSFTTGKDISFIAVGGKVTTGIIAEGVWTKEGTATNVYKFTYIAGYTNVANWTWDRAKRTTQGAPQRYTNVTSIAACDAAPGSKYSISGIVYVHAIDSRDLIIHGDEIINTIPLSEVPTITYTGNHKVYLKDIEFWGGTGGHFKLQSDSTAWVGSSFYGENCAYNANNDGNANGFACTDVAVCINVNSEASGNRRDGFNYHNYLGGSAGSQGVAPNFVEIDCQSHGNGLGGSEGNNQGSTAHEDCTGFRLGGDYSGHSDGGCIVDIDGAKVYHVAVTAKNSSTVGMLLSADGFPAGVNDAVWWIDGAYCSGNPVIADARGDIALDGFYTQLHMQDTNTEKPISTRAFSNLPDESFD